MILTGGQREHVSSIAHDDETGFLSRQKIFNDHTGTGIAHAVVQQHHVDRSLRFADRAGHDHPLACSQPIGLHHDGRTALGDVLACGCGIGERAIGRRRDAMARHEGLGKVLG